MLRRGDEPDRAAHARGAHLPQRIGQEGMPVPHADENRQRITGGCEPCRKTVRLPPRQLGNWRYAVEELVVMCHVFDAFRRHATAAQHVCQKRTDVLQTLRPAERDDENGIKTPHAILRLWAPRAIARSSGPSRSSSLPAHSSSGSSSCSFTTTISNTWHWPPRYSTERFPVWTS